MAKAASGTASPMWSACPAATSAAAALSSTTSRRQERSPSRIARMMAAFCRASPPAISSSGARCRPKSSGATSYTRTAPLRTSATLLGPEIVISSSPSRPWTTSARRKPSSLNASASFSTRSAEYTPTTCADAWAGFVSGPSKLNTVRNLSSRRAGCTYFIAECMAGANRKTMPVSRRQAAQCAGGKLILTPSASITSAEPHLELMLRLPCFATLTPAPAMTRATAVDMLKVPLVSPPVPQVSTRASRSVPLTSSASPSSVCSGTAALRMACAKPTISSTVSPFMCSATSSAAICASLASPRKICDMTSRASSRVSEEQWLATLCNASRSMNQWPVASGQLATSRQLSGHRNIRFGPLHPYNTPTNSLLTRRRSVWFGCARTLGRSSGMPRINDLDVRDLWRRVGPVSARIGIQTRNLLYHVEVLALPEDGVLAVQVRSRNFCDEKLRAVSVRPAVSHCQASGLVEGEGGAELILEGVAGTTGAVTGWIAALNHELRNDAMADGAVVERRMHHLAGLRVLPGLRSVGKGDEVGHGLRRLVRKQSAGDVSVGGFDDGGWQLRLGCRTLIARRRGAACGLRAY